MGYGCPITLAAASRPAAVVQKPAYAKQAAIHH